MLLCCILRGFGLSQRGYSAWAICWKIQAGIPWIKHMSTRISFLNPWNSKIMWFRSTFSKRPQAFWKGLRPFPGLFEKASGLFGNTTARSQREVSDMSTMIPDEVYGLGMPLLFGFHRKSVSSLRLSDLLCMSTFWKSAKKSQILSHEIYIQTSVFYDGFAAPGVFQHQRPFDTLWNTRTITGLLEKSTLVAK